MKNIVSINTLDNLDTEYYYCDCGRFTTDYGFSVGGDGQTMFIDGIDCPFCKCTNNKSVEYPNDFDEVWTICHSKKKIVGDMDEARTKFLDSYNSIKDKTNIYNYFYCDEYHIPFEICCQHSQDEWFSGDGSFAIRLISKWCVINQPGYNPEDIYTGMPQFENKEEYESLGKNIKILETKCSCDCTKCTL